MMQQQSGGGGRKKKRARQNRFFDGRGVPRKGRGDSTEVKKSQGGSQE